MSRNTATCLVQVSQPNDITLNAQLVLEQKPARQQQKLKTLTKYVQTYPSGWKKRFELGKLLYQMGRWQQAMDELSQVVERQPQAIDARLLLAHLLYLTGKKKEAISCYEQTLTWVQDDATRYHITGLIAQVQAHLQIALDSFERAALKEPDNCAHWLLLGQTQLDLEQPLAARRSFDVILFLKPNDVTALIYGYDALLQLEQVETAQQRLEQAYEQAPNDFRVLLRLANRRCQQRLVSGEDGETTLKFIRTVLQLVPQSAEAHYILAYYHVFRDETLQGKTVMQRFIEHHPNHPYGWYFYAQVLFRLGEMQKAADAIMRCYELGRCDREIYRALCKILPAADRLETLRPILSEMLTVFPMSWNLWATAGRTLIEKFDEHTLGLAYLAKANELAPDPVVA